jgi:MHS family proline/betaine transporter-like MFS transporter
MDFSKKEARTVLFAVTLGNLLEWYEIYLFVYWAPIIAKLFFNGDSELRNLTNTFLIFAVGFLARPIGGIFFGRLGDRIGRRQALIISLVMMTAPTFIMGFLPTHAQIGIFAPLLLVVMRLMQSFPAGAELPGAICYLYESSYLENRRYFSSWASIGYQMGILISTIECFLLEKLLTTEQLVTWGWRLSFLIGGVIGLLGLLLRSRLHETALYKEMLTHETIVKDSLVKVLLHYKKRIIFSMMFCALNSAAFYLITVNIAGYFAEIVGLSYGDSLLVNCVLLLIITIPIPLFGKLADKYNNQKMVIASAGGVIAILYPLYYSIVHSMPILLGVMIFLFCMFITCLSALLPYLLSDLFPTRVRFTCLGVSFNTVDTLIGGFTPAIALLLTQLTGNPASFCWFLLFCALLSLFSYFGIRKERHSVAFHHHNHSHHTRG